MKIKYEITSDLKKETKKRVAKLAKEFPKEPPDIKVFQNKNGYNGIVAQVGIPVAAVCEHHEVGIHGEVDIAYIPGEWVVGLSKLARVAIHYMNVTRKITQEDATVDIVKFLEKTLKPKGLMVIVRAKHDCITYRGIKAPSLTITSEVRGVFEDPEKGARQEFLQLVGNHHKD